MNIKLNRYSTNVLYTEGSLSINEEVQTQTIESTAQMLPPGLYTLRLISIHAHRRDLVIFDFHTGQTTGWQFSPTATSHIGCIREQAIAIGQELIPGALFKAQTDYERIIKRLEKCQKRGEPILLVIDDSRCRTSRPIKHWMRNAKLANNVS